MSARVYVLGCGIAAAAVIAAMLAATVYANRPKMLERNR